MRLTRWMVLAAAAPLMVCLLIGCGKKDAVSEAASASATTTQHPASATVMPVRHTPSLPKPVDPMVVLHTSAGDITLQLFPQKAPRTVENFLRSYAQRGFYDQTIFHHVEPGVMLIAGGYTADLQPKPTRAPIYNESHNGLSNRRDTVAMIRDPESPHSATSQFFINLSDNPDFDFRPSETEDVPGYCVFGEVIAGLEVIERIARLPTVSQEAFAKIPSPPVVLTSIERLQ